MPVQRDGGETDISQKADRDGRNRRADGTEFRNFEIQCIRKRSGTNSVIPEHFGGSIKYNEWCCVCLFRSSEGGSKNIDRKQHIHHRSEEHTSELQTLMRTSYAVVCLIKNKLHQHTTKYKL